MHNAGNAVLLIALLAVLSPGGAARADEEGHDARADEIVSGLMDSVEIKERACGPNAYLAPKLPVATCGKIPRKARKDTDGLLASIDAYFEGAGATPFEIGDDDSWRREGSAAHRVYSDGRVPITVSLDTTGGDVIVRYVARLQPCMTPDLPVAGEDANVVNPRVISRIQPEFPAEARRERISGRTQVMAVIRADGTVGDVCVQYARPEGYGFGEAAVEAIRQWRYEPGRVEGRPVDVLFTVLTTFDLR